MKKLKFLLVLIVFCAVSVYAQPCAASGSKLDQSSFRNVSPNEVSVE